MHHTCFEGNHYDMGLRWGAALAEKGFFLMERAPFPVTKQRRRFARESLPFYERYFPEILEELRALARGQGCPEEELEGAGTEHVCHWAGLCLLLLCGAETCLFVI